ncbi:hypothetical protein V5O48_016751 [Marasmius crinis-equi]|uniref:Uncharacterized protein n=1 Tax=Marasmius crinis-equi TaxID=585013 RepID=A0ABR3EQW4_9AGAR
MALPEEKPEILLDAPEVSRVLQVMPEDLVNTAATKGTSFLINSGDRIERPADVVMAETTVELDADGGYYLQYNTHNNYRGSRLELSVVIQLRTHWATANSPTGSAVLKEWKDFDSALDPAPLPTGVKIYPLDEARGYKSWVKRTTLNDLKWEELLFESHFRCADEGTSGEYTVSGSPVARDKMFGMFQLMNEKFSSILRLSPAEALHPPGSAMYVHAARQVFVPDNEPLDVSMALGLSEHGTILIIKHVTANRRREGGASTLTPSESSE